MTDVVVTGIGVVSPLGYSAAELARRVAAGECAVGGADGVSLGEVPLDAVPAAARARLGRADRLCRLFLAAACQAVDDARLPLPLAAPERVGLSFGTGLGCLLSDAEFYAKVVAQGAAAASPRVFAYTVSSAAAGEVSIALGVHGPNVTSHVGLAAGAGAIGYAADLLRLGRADVMLAGGADANGADLARALRDMGLLKTASQARPFVDAAPGVWPSEGAAVLVRERAEHAARRGAAARAGGGRWAAGFEPTLTRRQREPRGLTETLRRAAGTAPAPDLVLASAHGTPLDALERQALDATGCADARVVALKAQLGEAFGASGALAAALAVEQPERRALVSAICYSGSVVGLRLERV
ncbi:MAG: beta-ketoacyl synthase N-terminal-like domain-containing protein [Deltaproteobacteria bacterium]|nr:beta-ketoacyl synthase N-terminal-like domain-containing protein [Deltaproteobacteria bacterium]